MQGLLYFCIKKTSSDNTSSNKTIIVLIQAKPRSEQFIYAFFKIDAFNYFYFILDIMQNSRWPTKYMFATTKILNRF